MRPLNLLLQSRSAAATALLAMASAACAPVAGAPAAAAPEGPSGDPAHADAGGSPAGAPACSLPDAPLLITPGEYELAPGDTAALQVYSSTRPGAFERLPGSCRPAWSLSEDAPATLGPRSGVLRVSAEARDGARFTVRASLGEREVSTVVRVVDPVQSPLVGIWSQVGRTPCAAADEPAPATDPIRELRFMRNGRFSVTWVPFESYTDYAGSYTYDPASGALRLQVERSNFLPHDLDLDGHAGFDDAGVLNLADLWLGSRTPGEEAWCGMSFRRLSRSAGST